MVGFRLPERTVTLEFDPSFDLAGAEIEATVSLPLAAYTRVAEVIAALRQGGGAGFDEAMALFIAEGKPRWNLEDADGPVPVSVAGMRDHLEPRAISAILAAWLGHIGEVPSPLGATSSAGGPSADGSAKSRRRNSSPR